METLLILLCVVVFLLAIVMFSPVVIAVDSRQRRLRVRWLLALEFQMPLPGAAGRKSFTVFQKPFPVPPQQPAEDAAGAKKEKPAKTAAEVQKARSRRRAIGRFFVRCLGDSGIRRALARQLSMLLRRIFRSANLARSDARHLNARSRAQWHAGGRAGGFEPWTTARAPGQLQG